MKTPFERWRDNVIEAMRLICTTNNLHVGDWPEIPEELFRGVSSRIEVINVAYILLHRAGRLGLENAEDEEAE